MHNLNFYQNKQTIGNTENLQTLLETEQLNGPVHMDSKASYKLTLKNVTDPDGVVLMLLQAELPPQKILANTQIIEAHWHAKEITNSKEINSILTKYFDGNEIDDKVLLPLFNIDLETDTSVLYETENDICTEQQIRKAYENQTERKVLRTEFEDYTKDDSSQGVKQSSSQGNHRTSSNGRSENLSQEFKLQEVMPLVDLPRLIGNHYPEAKVNPNSRNPRCKAVWRGGDSFTVSLLRNGGSRWRFYDFKTGQGGDAYDFLVDIIGMDRSQARVEIASLVGINLQPSSKHLFKLDKSTKLLLETKLAEAKEQSLKEEKAKQKNLARELAEWEELDKKGKSAYLENKGIEALIKEDIKIHFGKEQSTNFIALKVQDTLGRATSIQKIYDEAVEGDTDKKFTWGGTIAGNYIVIGQGMLENKQVIVCEGFATGASIYLALEKQTVVFCALNAYNLEPVVKNIKEFYKAEIVIAVDNDQWNQANVGLNRGRLAALKHNSLIAVPDFKGLESNKPTDFNDLHLLAGLDRVKEAIEEAIKETNKVIPNLEELKQVIDLKKIVPFKHPSSGAMLSQESALEAVKASLLEENNEALAVLMVAYKQGCNSPCEFFRSD